MGSTKQPKAQWKAEADALMVADGRLINPADGLASSDHPRPGDVELAEAIDDTDGIAGVAGIDPAERASESDVDGDGVDTDNPKPEV